MPQMATLQNLLFPNLKTDFRLPEVRLTEGLRVLRLTNVTSKLMLKRFKVQFSKAGIK